MRITNRTRGQCSIEAIAGMILIIPVALFLLDMASIVLCSQANEALAKSAARAAAGVAPTAQPDPAQTAQRVIDQYKTNDLVNSVTIAWLNYNQGQFNLNSAPATASAPQQGKVIVVTKMHMRVPVPFPCFAEQDFLAQAVEPVVALPPQ